jgi:hypothetical protein
MGPQAVPQAARVTSPTLNSEEAKKTVPADLGPVERLTFEIPGYLTDAMRLDAAKNRSSLRHIILRGLAAIGYEVAEADLVPDARRRPPKRRKR